MKYCAQYCDLRNEHRITVFPYISEVPDISVEIVCSFFQNKTQSFNENVENIEFKVLGIVDDTFLFHL